MYSIAESEKNHNTCLKITCNADMTEDMGQLIPYPQKHFINNQIFIYYWYIDGFFGTKKALEFINDIKARFLISYPQQINEIRHFNTKEEANLHLKQFQGLKSRAVSIISETNRFDNTKDFVFWCLKLRAEELIIELGIVIYNDLLDFGERNFTTGTEACKDYSTLKSKCRSIVNYYDQKNYTLDRYQKKYTTPKELEDLKLTRQENLQRIKDQRKQDTQDKIKHFITGIFATEYKWQTQGKNKGKWNVSKLSKVLELSRPTLISHLKEMGEYQ